MRDGGFRDRSSFRHSRQRGGITSWRQVTRSNGALPRLPMQCAKTVVGWEHSGDGDTELYNPQGVFWDPWRFYIIADRGNHRVQRCVATVLHAPLPHGDRRVVITFCGGRGRQRRLRDFGHVEQSHIRRCVAGTPSPYCQTVTAYGELNLSRGPCHRRKRLVCHR